MTGPPGRRHGREANTGALEAGGGSVACLWLSALNRGAARRVALPPVRRFPFPVCCSALSSRLENGKNLHCWRVGDACSQPTGQAYIFKAQFTFKHGQATSSTRTNLFSSVHLQALSLGTFPYYHSSLCCTTSDHYNTRSFSPNTVVNWYIL